LSWSIKPQEALIPQMLAKLFYVVGKSDLDLAIAAFLRGD
jgi:hypothetical protein